MVIHRLVPQANDNIANGLDVKVGCIVVVGDGDGQLDGVAPGKRGIERRQRLFARPSALPQTMA